MGNQNALLKQPDYYFQLKLKAYFTELIKRLSVEEEKYNKEYLSSTRGTDKSRMALFYMESLNAHVEELKLYSKHYIEYQIDGLQEYFKKIKGDSIFKNNVKLNIEKLSSLEKKYISELQSAALVKEDPVLVTTWYLDVSKIKNIPYIPLAQSCISCHRGDKQSSKPNVVVADARTMPVAFHYADGSNQIIQDSYISYWKYAKDGKKGQFAAPNNEIMIPVGIGYTDRSGNLYQSLPMTATTNGLKIYETQESDGSISHQLELLKSQDFANLWQRINHNYSSKPEDHISYYSSVCPSCHTSTRTNQQVMAPSKQMLDNIAYQRLNMGKFDKTADYGFMVYPMDHGEIRTLDLDKITTIKVPAGGSTAKHIAYKDSISKAATVVTDQRLTYLKFLNSGHIALHCTLPEWDKRLRDAYDEANYWFQLIELCKDVHRKQELKLDNMTAAVNAQIRYPFSKQTPSQYENRKILQNGVMTAKSVIHERYSNFFEFGESRKSGDSEKKEADQIQVIKKQFNIKMKILWDLLNNKALKAELFYYLDHVNKQISNGVPPVEDKAKGIKPHYPGPYMAIEPEWMRIIFTLNDCYAMLANSTEFKEKTWNTDLKYGYEAVLNLKGLNTFYSKWALEIDNYTTNGVNKDFSNDKIFSKDQSTALGEKTKQIEPNTSISSKIISFFDDLLLAEQKYYGDSKIKDFLGLAIPTLGPPNLVQTMVNLYNSYSFKTLQQQNKTAHMRMVVAYFYLSGYIKFDKSGKPGRSYTKSFQFLLTVFVRGPSNNPSKHAITTKALEKNTANVKISRK